MKHKKKSPEKKQTSLMQDFKNMFSSRKIEATEKANASSDPKQKPAAASKSSSNKSKYKSPQSLKSSSSTKDNVLTGKIKRHPDGFGFFIPEDLEHPDVYIPKHGMTGIMTGDRITIKAYPEGRGDDRFRGEVVSILQRGTNKIVGKFQSQTSYGLIKDEGKGWGQDLYIKQGDSLNAKSGDLVTAEILEYPDESKSFTGKVLQVLGDINDPMNDIKRVLAAQNIPDVFPQEVIEESKKYNSVPSEKDFKNRKDLRQKTLITIDGATAKDFDDAILTEMTPNGFRLFVAIADVSHYVKMETAIDDEAYLRGNSVYFPNFVVPMLPEVLSNGLCSLNPHVPRLCLVAEMEFDFVGARRSCQIYEAVMDSKARMTYGEAQEIVDGADLDKPEIKQMAAVKENILRSADLAKLLMAKRYKEGSLDLEIPETELLIDASGTPIDVIRSERLFSHRLIEEMMLAANVAVAEFLSDREIPALYRVHENPNPTALGILEKYLALFGGRIKLDAGSLAESKNGAPLAPGRLQKKLTKALEEFKDKPEGQILHILTLRSMAQAKYSTKNLGHFGLGFQHYTHFTSPIRRYPDLIVHRLLKSQIMPHSDYEEISEDDLASAGTMLSACEQKAAKSERQIKSIKKARFLQKFLGEEFDGIISSVTRFGVFVLLREYDVDGLIKIDDLSSQSGSNDRFVYDEENLRLVAKRSGFTFEIGNRVKIQVVSADIELGQVNFTLIEKIETGEKPRQFEKIGRSVRSRSSGRNDRAARTERQSKAARSNRTTSSQQQRTKDDKQSSATKVAFIQKPRFQKTEPLNQPTTGSGKASGSRRDQILQMLDESIAKRGTSSGFGQSRRKDDRPGSSSGRRDSKGKDRATKDHPKDKNQSSRSNFKKRR
ncbi:MAG: ribonuclease R [Pseudobdellovibrionaceae bacterium]